MQIQLRYFARLRERFERAEEALDLPADVATVGALVAHLIARGGVWAEELGGARVFRAALNQELVPLDTPLHEGAEVALFPPVTGG